MGGFCSGIRDKLTAQDEQIRELRRVLAAKDAALEQTRDSAANMLRKLYRDAEQLANSRDATRDGATILVRNLMERAQELKEQHDAAAQQAEQLRARVEEREAALRNATEQLAAKDADRSAFEQDAAQQTWQLRSEMAVVKADLAAAELQTRDLREDLDAVRESADRTQRDLRGRLESKEQALATANVEIATHVAAAEEQRKEFRSHIAGKDAELASKTQELMRAFEEAEKVELQLRAQLADADVKIANAATVAVREEKLLRAKISSLAAELSATQADAAASEKQLRAQMLALGEQLWANHERVDQEARRSARRRLFWLVAAACGVPLMCQAAVMCQEPTSLRLPGSDPHPVHAILTEASESVLDDETNSSPLRDSDTADSIAVAPAEEILPVPHATEDHDLHVPTRPPPAAAQPVRPATTFAPILLVSLQLAVAALLFVAYLAVHQYGGLPTDKMPPAIAALMACFGRLSPGRGPKDVSGDVAPATAAALRVARQQNEQLQSELSLLRSEMQEIRDSRTALSSPGDEGWTLVTE